MQSEIDVYDAKTRLAELLRHVKAGRSFTITERGKAVADLVPSKSDRAVDASAAIDMVSNVLAGVMRIAPT